MVASYDDQPRNPVLLEAACWDEVCAAAVGDEGARAWLRAHPQRVRVVACDDLGDATDVDEPEDLRRLVEDTR